MKLYPNQTGLGAHSLDNAVRFRRIVQNSEVDELGHVNNAVYVHWLQDAALGHWFHIATENLMENFVWVCFRHEVDYRLPILPGEEVEIRTWLGKRQGARLDRHTDIRKAGANRASVEAVTTWVMIKKENNRPQRVGDDVLRAFGLTPQHHDSFGG
ncbi:MAG: thioesterase family protein [Pseudomonadota bacterium]